MTNLLWNTFFCFIYKLLLAFLIPGMFGICKWVLLFKWNKSILKSIESTILCYITAAKGETDDEEWSHGHRKTKTEESETRNSNFEELGFKFKNTSLTNTPFHSTHSPQSKSPHTSYPIKWCMGENSWFVWNMEKQLPHAMEFRLNEFSMKFLSCSFCL